MNLEDGKLGVYRHAFIPEGRFMMMGYVAQGLVCLECGLLMHYLGERDLEEIQRRG